MRTGQIENRGLHPSTFQLNVGTLCRMCWSVSLTKAYQVELRGKPVEALVEIEMGTRVCHCSHRLSLCTSLAQVKDN